MLLPLGKQNGVVVQRGLAWCEILDTENHTWNLYTVSVSPLCYKRYWTFKTALI